MTLQFHLLDVGVRVYALLFVATQQVDSTDGNIALHKPAFMSSVHSGLKAFRGVDGNIDTYFHTSNTEEVPWWAVDFGAGRTRVTRVRIVNLIDKAAWVAHRLTGFTVGLTDHRPLAHLGPLQSPFQECARHYPKVNSGEAVNLDCAVPLYAWGRFLFVAAHRTYEFFNVAEIEVYDDFDPSVIHMSGYRDDYNVSYVTDLNNATCQQVTTQESDEPFTLKVEFSNTVLSRLTVTAVVDEGDCLDFPATMVYTEGDQSAMLPYHNNPSFCDNTPGRCVFECDCSATACQNVYLVILSAPDKSRKLCELFIT